MIKKIIEKIKSWFRPKEQKEQMDPHEVMLHPRGYCIEHSKYKHRCPKCRELARMA
jgi:hypothetical protein